MNTLLKFLRRGKKPVNNRALICFLFLFSFPLYACAYSAPPFNETQNEIAVGPAVAATYNPDKDAAASESGAEETDNGSAGEPEPPITIADETSNREDPATGDPGAPAGELESVAPALAPEPGNFCSLSVICDTVLLNIEKLKPEKLSLIPENGVIFFSGAAEIEEGDSVFDLLVREMKNAKIHMEFSGSKSFGTIYIKGINNLYEFDCGELSGWEYRVNGMFPGGGCSFYKPDPGDFIEIVYTCDLGRDIGGVIGE